MKKERSEQYFTADHIKLAQRCIQKAIRAAGIHDADKIGIEKDDLMQEAYIAMSKAYREYDEKHPSNAKLETYLYVCVKNKTTSEIKRIAKKHRSEEEVKKLLESEQAFCHDTLSEPVLDIILSDIARKASPYVRYADEERLTAILKALSAYDFQTAAAESVGVSKDMMKHIMKDFRQFLKDNPEEAELFKMSLTGGA